MLRITASHIKFLIQTVRQNRCKNYVNEKPIRLTYLLCLENIFYVPIVICVEDTFSRSLVSPISIWPISWLSKIHQEYTMSFKVFCQNLPFVCFYMRGVHQVCVSVARIYSRMYQSNCFFKSTDYPTSKIFLFRRCSIA